MRPMSSILLLYFLFYFCDGDNNLFHQEQEKKGTNMELQYKGRGNKDQSTTTLKDKKNKAYSNY